MKRGYIKIDETLCKGCGLCVETCPKGLIAISTTLNLKGYYFAQFHDEKGRCTGCALCAVVCPEVAFEVYREEKANER